MRLPKLSLASLETASLGELRHEKQVAALGIAHAALFSLTIHKLNKAFQSEDSIMVSRFGKLGILLVAMASTALVNTNAMAQSRELLRGNMIPGQASQIRRLSSPSKAGQIQAVKVIAPDGVQLSVVNNGSFVATGGREQTVGMQLGSLYRFRISGIESATRFEFFPSVELLDLLHPPKGLENDFPIQVVINEVDIREVIAGRLVTKVIYLEDPEVALPRAGDKSEQPYFDVSATEDPVRAAEGLGRSMAILRIGSRIPTDSELATAVSNAFNSATPATTSPSFQPSLRNNPKYRSPAFPAQGSATRGLITTPIVIPEAAPLNNN